MVVSEVLPGQGLGDLGDDRLGVGHVGESKNWKYLFETTAEKTDLTWQKAGQPIMSNIHFHQLHLPNSSPKNTFTFFDNILNCSNFIVITKKCFLGSLRIYKSSSNCEKFLN